MMKKFKILIVLTVFLYGSATRSNPLTTASINHQNIHNITIAQIEKEQAEAKEKNDELCKLFKPSAKLTSITPDAQKIIAYIARVSNPKNQDNDQYEKLLKYCIKNQHWSVFEQAFMTIEIETSRAICTQLLRHRSFTFQQFSQRYADNSLLTNRIPLFEVRTQDCKNRQNSCDTLTDQEKENWYKKIEAHNQETMKLYQDMLAAGIAKECARFILPENMPARIYMSGSIRSWIHYIELRSANGTQKEHQQVAELCKQIFIEQLPHIAQALNWTK